MQVTIQCTKSVSSLIMIRWLFISVIIVQCHFNAQANDGICPDSIIVFQHNDLEFSFQVENAEPETVITWSFGDGIEVTGGTEITHVFEEGNYTITAILMDGDCLWDGPYTITADIVVSPCWLELSYVALKEGFYTFTATGYPEKYPMYWEMGDGTSIIETWVVDHQYAPGTYEVCAWITSDFCYVDTLEACVTFTYEITEAVNEVSHQTISLYPNPTSGLLQLSETQIDHLTLTSGEGKLLWECRACHGPLDMRTHQDGVYFLTIVDHEGHTEIRRIILQRD